MQEPRREYRCRDVAGIGEKLRKIGRVGG